MKHSKLLTFIALTLAMLTLLSACGGNPDIKLKKLLIKDSAPTEYAPLFTSLKEVPDFPQKLADVDISSSGNLRQFYMGNKNDIAVYNITTNSIVWSGTNTDKLQLSVSFYNISAYNEKASCFVVKSTELKTQKTTSTLYTQSGEAIETAAGASRVIVLNDLLFFNEKCYRCAENGAITYAFDYSSFSYLPNRLYKHDDIYYEWDQKTLTVYDSCLNRIGTYSVPGYVEAEGKVNCLFPLESEKFFVQYTYKADDHSDDYTYISQDQKYIVVTQIVNVKRETVKTIDCEYSFIAVANVVEYNEQHGLDTKALGWGQVCLIEDKRLSTECTVTINKKGELSLLENINGEPISYITLFAENRWLAYAADDKVYLIDEKGKTLGEISGVGRFGCYFRTDKKIYDASLNLVYDFSHLKFLQTVRSSILLQDANGGLLLYTGGSEPIVLTNEAPQDFQAQHGTYIMIKNNDVWTVYNEAGAVLGTMEGEIVSQEINHNGSAHLIKVINAEQKYVYYHLG